MGGTYLPPLISFPAPHKLLVNCPPPPRHRGHSRGRCSLLFVPTPTPPSLLPTLIVLAGPSFALTYLDQARWPLVRARWPLDHAHWPLAECTGGGSGW
jgi:hypothetical protein